MKNSAKNYTLATLAAIMVLIAMGTGISFAQNSSSAESQRIYGQRIVMTKDLAAAGFAFPSPQLPTDDGNYPASVSYFWVGTDAQRSPAKNLVMISKVNVLPNVQNLFSYGTTRKDFPIEGGVGKEAELGGNRTAINFLKHGTYVVVIGPSVSETEALASIIASKIE